MKKNLILLLFVSVFSLFILSCETEDDSPNDPNNNDSTNTVTLTGKVISAATGDNLDGAQIKITNGIIVKGAITNENGEFSSTFEISTDIDLAIIAKLDGYISDTTSVFAIRNSTIQIPYFRLQKDNNSNVGGLTSGGAASINLSSQSSSSIGVKESGSIESADIVFEVRDSSGILIDESHTVEINFSFGATPNGGEYLFPASVNTNALGRAAVTLNTGSIAGVVQIIAETTIGSKTIRSKPILVAIHGGFPFEDHFYVASKKLNYPALGIIGETIEFTAYAGDKYNNPVRPGTSIYFTTNSGIIGGSSLTGELGTASVNLLTEPWPNDPEFGEGFFRVTATSADENLNTISAETIRLQSGAPNMTVNPNSFTLNNGGSQSFSFTIADLYGNPMSEGQNISVSVESDFVKVAGTTNLKLPDTQSKSWTEFSFTAYDSGADTIHVETVTIEIETSGPNSDNKIIITGSAR